MKCFFVIIVTMFMIGCKSQYDLSNTHYVLILKAYEDTFSLRRNDLYFVTRDSGYFEQRLNESLNIDTVESINRQTFRYNYIKRNKIILSSNNSDNEIKFLSEKGIANSKYMNERVHQNCFQFYYNKELEGFIINLKNSEFHIDMDTLYQVIPKVSNWEIDRKMWKYVKVDSAQQEVKQTTPSYTR